MQPCCDQVTRHCVFAGGEDCRIDNDNRAIAKAEQCLRQISQNSWQNPCPPCGYFRGSPLYSLRPPEASMSVRVSSLEGPCRSPLYADCYQSKNLLEE